MNREELKVNFEDWKKGDIKYFNVSNEKISKLGINFKKNFENVLNSVIEEYKKLYVINIQKIL